MNLNLNRLFLGTTLGFAVASAVALPANALTIVPTFDSSITGAANASDVEGAINTALNTIDALYVNPGTVNLVFNQEAGDFLGESDSGRYNVSYSNLVTQLTADHNAHPTNTVLTTALANLSHGNDGNGASSISATSAYLRVLLGFSGATPCFNVAGAFVPTCNQLYDGVVTISSSEPFFYSVPTSGPLPSGFDAIAAMEHEVNEILGGGGQGSVLNFIQQGMSQYDNLFGPLDLFRYDGFHAPSFSLTDLNSYLSVDGGLTYIVGFNGNPAGDYGDFSTNTDVQSAFSNPNQAPPHNTSTPEFPMMEALGWDGVLPVPEPASIAVLIPALAVLRRVRRRRS